MTVRKGSTLPCLGWPRSRGRWTHQRATASTSPWSPPAPRDHTANSDDVRLSLVDLRTAALRHRQIH